MKRARPFFPICLFLAAVAVSGLFCRKAHAPAPLSGGEAFQIIREIKQDSKSPFFIDFDNYPKDRNHLPIGIFDSGTGGLTVLDAILKMDEYDNRTHKPGGDGLPDFIEESFLYFGDKANMPYGRYDSEGRSDFLRELTLKDVQFLLGKTYHLHPEDSVPRRDKPQVKAIVIACNTATAYGLELIREAVREWGLDIAVIGIVDAGSRAAGTRLAKRDMPTLVGIFATEGTCASGGYPAAVERNFSDLGAGPVEILQQPGFGWAGAVDGDSAYIDPLAGEVRGRMVYQGPGFGHDRYPIEPERMREYRFDRMGNALLVRKDSRGRPVEIELNSVTNYIRFYVTRMVLEAVRNHPGRSLDAVILGCTHYPFFKQEIREQFDYLRNLDQSYAALIPADLPLIDPAVSEAVELYEYLKRGMLFGSNSFRDSLFFISVPNPGLARNRLDDRGAFPLEYKYGRSINQSLAYVRRVPLTGARLASNVLARIRDKMPLIHEIMKLDEGPLPRAGF